MVDIAGRNLLEEKLRFIISSGGVALAIMLILILNGFFAGMNRQVSAYLDNTTADLVVSQKKVKNFLGTNSRVPLSAISKLESIKGVEKVVPLFSTYAVLAPEGRREFSLIIGFDPLKGGGPWRLTAGTSDINDDQVIVDKVIADRHGFKLGEKINILGKDFTITALSTGTSSWMTGTFFITFDAASRLLSAKDTAAFLLVTIKDKAKINDVKQEISGNLEDLTVTEKHERSANDVALYASVFNGPLRLMVIIAFLIGVMLVGATIYTATIERAREYGVLKAIGIKNHSLYLVVFEQALLASLAGFVSGVGLSYVAIFIINNLLPQFLILIEPVYVAEVFVVSLLISILASYIPVRTIAAIDPAIAFRRGA